MTASNSTAVASRGTPASPSTTPSAVQRSAGGGTRAITRGTSFAQGEAMLAPVQKRASGQAGDAGAGQSPVPAQRGAQGAPPSQASAPASAPAPTPAPAGQAPAGAAPAGQAPAGQAPAGQAPAGQTPGQAPGGGAPGAGGEIAQRIRQAHPNGLTVSLGVAATFANEAERAANVAAAADPATRRRAIELIDVAAWGIVYGRWIASNATAMDTYAREQGQPNFASLTGRTRASVRSAIWTAHSREIKAAMVNDPAIWARLNLVTQGQSTHFLNEANAFAGAHNAVAATGGTLRMGRPAMQFSTPGDLISQVNAVNAAARTALGDPNAAKIRNLGIFTHGWRNGMGGRHGGGGQDIQDPNALASQMSGALTSDVHVGLYACGTAGHGAAEGSFADRLRDALVVDHPDAVVLGHTTEADTVANEEVRIFGGREGMNDANFHRIFPRTLTAPARAEFEAELHRPVSVGDFNRAMIYFYNREFLWTARASDISATNDPTRLQAAAHQWFTSFVREPQWRRAIIARLPGAAPRRNVSRPPRGGAPATAPAS